MLTPFGVLGGLRGVLFFNIGGSGFNNAPFKPIATKTEDIPLLLGFEPIDVQGNLGPVFGPSIPVSGLRLVDSQASYGIGLQTALLGFPIHFDWSWKTRFNRLYEDVIFAFNALQIDPSGFTSGSSLFRKVKFSFWIGYDF
jgi:hypothetical protein